MLRLLACALLVAHSVVALDNGLGLKPQMGFNTWNRFGCNINETLIRDTADALVSSGLASIGYTYLNIDDCWAKSRDSSGRVVPDSSTFPSGIKAVADYVHSKGLKFGIYSDAGSKTCAGRPGSLFYEAQDASSYAEWGVDYLKYDNCNAPSNMSAPERYARMTDALNATGRPIFFSLCDWGVEDPWKWGPKTGNSWRTTMDISDKYGSFVFNLFSTVPLAKYAGPGGWNDPDMLEVGNGGMSTAAYRSHFALWAAMKAPLLIGTDVTAMSADTKRILFATEVIAVNQDDLGVAADWVAQDDNTGARVMGGPLADGSRVAVLFNSNTTSSFTGPLNITVTFEQLGLPAGSTAAVRDLFAQKDLGSFEGQFTALVQPEDSTMVKVTPAQQVGPELAAWRPWHAHAATPEERVRAAATAVGAATA